MALPAISTRSPPCRFDLPQRTQRTQRKEKEGRMVATEPPAPLSWYLRRFLFFLCALCVLCGESLQTHRNGCEPSPQGVAAMRHLHPLLLLALLLPLGRVARA